MCACFPHTQALGMGLYCGCVCNNTGLHVFVCWFYNYYFGACVCFVSITYYLCTIFVSLGLTSLTLYMCVCVCVCMDACAWEGQTQNLMETIFDRHIHVRIIILSCMAQKRMSCFFNRCPKIPVILYIKQYIVASWIYNSMYTNLISTSGGTKHFTHC